MREMKGYHVEHFQFEFPLLRIQGGLLDLRTALVDDWSPIRSDAAIRRFRRLVKRMAVKNKYTDPRTWFTAMGMNYDEHYAGRFVELSERYVDRLVEFSWTAAWPFAMAEWSGWEMFWRKLKGKMGFENSRAIQMFLSWPRDFDEITRDYLAELLSSNVGEGVRTIVLHNAFEPFNPSRSLHFFDSAKCLIVDRDPRDNYVAGLWYRPTRLPVDQFIRRYRIYRQVAEHFDNHSPDILRVQYEELVLNYDTTVGNILQFLGEDPSAHAEPRKYFDPEVSRKNVGVWKNYGNQAEIEAIRRELKEYCRDL